MRHLWSLVAGIVAAPLAWLAIATGQHRSVRSVAGWQEAGQFDTVDLIGPVIFLVAAGVLLGLVGTLRSSPAGALAAGVLLVIPTIFMFVNPFETLDAFSYDQTDRWLGQDLQLWRPVENGTLLVLGSLLLVAVLSAQRWRHWPEPAPPIETGPGPAEPATTPVGPPGYGSYEGGERSGAPEASTGSPAAGGAPAAGGSPASGASGWSDSSGAAEPPRPDESARE